MSFRFARIFSGTLRAGDSLFSSSSNSKPAEGKRSVDKDGKAVVAAQAQAKPRRPRTLHIFGPKYNPADPSTHHHAVSVR